MSIRSTTNGNLRGNFEGYRLVKGPKQLLITGAKTFGECYGRHA